MSDLPARESMEFDVVVVGAGPAGLATAIRLKQKAAEAGADLSVVVVEKGSEVGAHILSGAVIDPIGLDALLPDWRTDPDRPLKTQVTADEFMYLGHAGGVKRGQFRPYKAGVHRGLGEVCAVHPLLDEQAGAVAEGA